MNQHAWTIAGGGIGGLAAAVALAREGVQAQVVEQASAWAEVGAGIQLGPNVTRILRDWNLEEELRACASFPDALVVRDAVSGVRLGQLRLGREDSRLISPLWHSEGSSRAEPGTEGLGGETP